MGACAMEHMPETVREEFEVNGNFVVKKTKKRFSIMPIDQAHEHNNEMVKGSGGAVGLTDYPTAIRKWIIEEQEQARIINEFEGLQLQKEICHEETSNHLIKFQKKPSSLIAKLEEKENRFIETGKELLTIDNHDVCNGNIVQFISTLEKVGQKKNCV
ncbi:hypothetical protein DPMN_116943 [Dreissena polymorpha]|uniref:Uncharacterized protein n=1 Tax=Dreissena polymorpha TaxID=45954 RepID=A0A9D4KNX6_DREPO|nr:hypothetical protein DPMN_116943 [Dreissena polymorpha]